MSARFVRQFPSFANRCLSRRLVRSASGDDGGNSLGVRTQSIFQVAVLKSPALAPLTPHQTVTLGECNGISCSSLGFTGDQYRMFYLFTKPERWKWAYSGCLGFSVAKVVARSNAPLRLTIWNGVLSSIVPLPANHDKLSRRRNIQIWNVSAGSAPPCTLKMIYYSINDLRFVVLGELPRQYNDL
jgi:hypothetical protein